MVDLIGQLATQGTSLVLVVLVMVWLGSGLRTDRHLSRRLEERIRRLEHDQRRDGRRIVQLEDVLRLAGMTVPPWPELDDDLTEPRHTYRRKS